MPQGPRFIWTLVVASVPIFSLQAQEVPPYSPPVEASLMTSYVNSELGFTIRFPVEFKVGTSQDLHTLMDLGHREGRGTDPESDQEHAQAVRCMHSLLYATSEAPNSSVSRTEKSADAPDTILVVDFDRSCMPKKVKGDKTQTQLAGTVLNLPGMAQLVPQSWFVAGGNRRIHSGMAGGIISIPASGKLAEHCHLGRCLHTFSPLLSSRKTTGFLWHTSAAPTPMRSMNPSHIPRPALRTISPSCCFRSCSAR